MPVKKGDLRVRVVKGAKAVLHLERIVLTSKSLEARGERKGWK